MTMTRQGTTSSASVSSIPERADAAWNAGIARLGEGMTGSERWPTLWPMVSATPCSMPQAGSWIRRVSRVCSMPEPGAAGLPHHDAVTGHLSKPSPGVSPAQMAAKKPTTEEADLPNFRANEFMGSLLVPANARIWPSSRWLGDMTIHRHPSNLIPICHGPAFPGQNGRYRSFDLECLQKAIDALQVNRRFIQVRMERYGLPSWGPRLSRSRIRRADRVGFFEP